MQVSRCKQILQSARVFHEHGAGIAALRSGGDDAHKLVGRDGGAELIDARFAGNRLERLPRFLVDGQKQPLGTFAADTKFINVVGLELPDERTIQSAVHFSVRAKRPREVVAYPAG